MDLVIHSWITNNTNYTSGSEAVETQSSLQRDACSGLLEPCLVTESILEASLEQRGVLSPSHSETPALRSLTLPSSPWPWLKELASRSVSERWTFGVTKCNLQFPAVQQTVTSVKVRLASQSFSIPSKGVKQSCHPQSSLHSPEYPKDTSSFFSLHPRSSNFSQTFSQTFLAPDLPGCFFQAALPFVMFISPLLIRQHSYQDCRF